MGVCASKDKKIPIKNDKSNKSNKSKSEVNANPSVKKED